MRRVQRHVFLWRLRLNRQQKRIFKRNADLHVQVARPGFGEDTSTLYQRATSSSAMPMATCTHRVMSQFSTFLVRDLPFPGLRRSSGWTDGYWRWP